ncbi:MAG: phosphonopyruvate decarboxylase [Pseudomonadota bacterium]
MDGAGGENWPAAIHQVLARYRVTQVGYVPDAGHAALIRMVDADPSMQGVVLTTEEEGMALATGAWLGGGRGALLMQSSGVGNCINMLSLIKTCRVPFLTIVTMRGEWGEFNPWQIPMGNATEAALGLMDLQVLRAGTAAEVGPMVEGAARLAYDGGAGVAVLLSQWLIGAKEFSE